MNKNNLTKPIFTNNTNMEHTQTVSPSMRGNKGEKKTRKTITNPYFSKEFIKQRGLICNGNHLPYNPNNREYAKQLRKNMTLHEKLLRKFLRKQTYRTLRQHPIDHYIVDFYIASANLIIEVDGESHFTKYAQQYDKQRTDFLNIYGLKVIRFTNDQVIAVFREVCRQIDKEVQMRREK